MTDDDDVNQVAVHEVFNACRQVYLLSAAPSKQAPVRKINTNFESMWVLVENLSVYFYCCLSVRIMSLLCHHAQHAYMSADEHAGFYGWTAMQCEPVLEQGQRSAGGFLC
jgi:hypothetical protein